MLVSADFKKRALNGLSGNWGVAVGTGFVAILLGSYTAMQGGDVDMEALFQHLPLEVLMTLLSILDIIATVAFVYSIVSFIIGGPITLGYVKFNLDMLNGNRPHFTDLFSQFGRFKEAFCMQFLRALFIFLWSLLLLIPGKIAGFSDGIALYILAIPGTIAAYSYAMAPYILYENPGMSASEAITASKKMMDGNKWRLFCLNFSFIGWAFLAILTLGIGFLWLNPYMEASYAAFYEELKREQSGRSAQTDSNYSL